MHALIEQHGYVIAFYPASVSTDVTRRLHAVRSVLESDRIALLGVDLPPLGLALLAQQLRQLSVCDFSPGVLASSARLLAHYIYAGALLGSVAKLDRVPVSPEVARQVLGAGRPVRRTGQSAAPAGPARAHGEKLAGPGVRHADARRARGSCPSDWVTATLAPAWRVQGVATVPLPAESRALVGHGEAGRVRRRTARRVRALPTGLVRTARGVPLVRTRTHRRPLRFLRGASAPAAGASKRRRTGSFFCTRPAPRHVRKSRTYI